MSGAWSGRMETEGVSIIECIVDIGENGVLRFIFQLVYDAYVKVCSYQTLKKRR
jgi:hypothetical protein